MIYIKQFGLQLFVLFLCLSSIASEDEYQYDDYDDTNLSGYDDYSNSSENHENKIASTRSTTTISPKITTALNIETTTVPVHQQNCPEICSCTDGILFVDCSNRELTTVPLNLPQNSIKIDFSNNQLTNLSADMFPQNLNVRQLDFAGNQIETVAENTFGKLQKLSIIDLSSNIISHLHPNTFTDAIDLTNLTLNYNPITTVPNEPFLNQPELEVLNLQGCGITELYNETFSQLGSLIELNLSGNQLSNNFNIEAFEPINRLRKLEIATLSSDSVFNLCGVLKEIDVISTDEYRISCYKFVSGTTFDESTVTDAPKPTTTLPIQEVVTPPPSTTTSTTTTTTEAPTITTAPPETNIAKSSPAKPFAIDPNNDEKTTAINIVSENQNQHLANNESSTSIGTTEATTASDNTMKISSESMKNILIGIIVVASAGLILGLLCRSDVFGIKTKLCRSKSSPRRRPPPTDQVRPAEEVPLKQIV